VVICDRRYSIVNNVSTHLLKWRPMPDKKRGNLRYALTYNVIWMKFLSITVYAHVLCLTYRAVPPLCRVSDVISSSVDTSMIRTIKQQNQQHVVSAIFITTTVVYNWLYHYVIFAFVCLKFLPFHIQMTFSWYVAIVSAHKKVSKHDNGFSIISAHRHNLFHFYQI